MSKVGKWLLLLPLVAIPSGASAFFQTNVGDTLTAHVAATVSSVTGTLSITPFLVQPDGYSILGTAGTTGTLTVVNPELGTYLMGVQIQTGAASSATVTLPDFSNTMSSAQGFSFTYVSNAPVTANVTANSTTQLTIPVVYMLPGFPP
jgi:hypothetical protein